MKRQKSFKNDRPSLYLVATPIGNLKEFSTRSIEILSMVDVIACEDTRNSGQLFKHFGIKKPLISYHNYNEKDSSKGILSLLEEGKTVALVSDAGYPLISDPGYQLVQDCIAQDYNVISVNGSSACLSALVASGLDTNHYLFYGFLHAKDREQCKELEQLKQFPYTMIFYESPHRIQRTLNNIYQVFGERSVCLARELTKIHEEYVRGLLSEIKDIEDVKGEIVLVVEGYHHDKKAISMDEIVQQVKYHIDCGCSAKDAVARVAMEYQVPKKEVYSLYHKHDFN